MPFCVGPLTSELQLGMVLLRTCVATILLLGYCKDN
jgi:hypothetical protein